MTSSRAHILNALTVGMLIVGSLAVFGTLPERIPRHAALTGEVDAFWETTLFNWMLVPMIGAGLAVFLYAMSAFIGRRLDALSIPNQEKFDALTTDQKERVVAVIQRFLYWTAFALTALLLAIHGSFYRSAVNPDASFSSGWMSMMSLAVPFGIVVGAVWAALRARRLVGDLSD